MRPLSKVSEEILFFALTVIIVASIFIGTLFKLPFIYLVPFGALFLYFSVFNFKIVYYLLIFVIPFTREFYLPGNLGLDIPGEPILIFLFFICILFFFAKRKSDFNFFNTGIIQMLIIHLIWIAVAVTFSEKPVVSIKFLLAKLWFILPFVFLTGLIIKKADDFKTVFWSVVIPAAVTIVVILLKHWKLNFSFEDVNKACELFYRNHVNYSAFISLLVPFIWLAVGWYRHGTAPRYVLQALKVLFLVGIYFSFARGAWMALIASVIFYLALKNRFIKFLTIPAAVFIIWAGIYLVTENNYLKFAPEFDKAIYHGNIIDHLKATLKNQDISTAERFYRWVAGARMSLVHPVTGYGPGSFYYFYKDFTVTSFLTYVSDNPEKSGVHNYFLMTLVEQGIPGLIIFLLLTYTIFSSGVQAYHLAGDPKDKNFIAAILCSMVIIYVQLMLSDLVESFKIGSFFFINLAMLTNQIVRQKKEKIYQVTAQSLEEPAAQ